MTRKQKFSSQSLLLTSFMLYSIALTLKVTVKVRMRLNLLKLVVKPLNIKILLKMLMKAVKNLKKFQIKFSSLSPP